MSEQSHEPGVSTNYDLVLVDQSKDARDAARIAADARLTHELNEGGRFKRFIKGIWKGNIAKDYYRAKYEQQAQRSIENSQDVLIHESTDSDRRNAAMNATIDRFQSEYDEMLHTEAGESKQELSQQSELTQSLKSIIRQFAEGQINEAALIEERARVLQAYRDEHGQELTGDGVVQIDNMLNVAQSVKGAVEHGESIDAIMQGMRVISGESRSGVRTEVEYTKFDKLLEKLGKSKVGMLIGSEATIAAATIAMSVARFGSKKAIGTAAMTIAPGLGAGLLAGAREKKRVKDDWAQHSREMAQGKEFDLGAKRRTEMEAARYETVAANDLIASLGIHLEDGGLDSDQALQTALDKLAAIGTRESLSDSRSIDLISYSSATSVEEERFQLALARAQVKVALNGRLDEDVRQRLGIGQGTIDELILERGDSFIDMHESDIDTKDAIYRKLRNRRVATAAATGALAGLTFGVVSQEVGAALSDTREGLVEQLWSHHTKPFEGSEHQSLLKGVFDDRGYSVKTIGATHSFFQETIGQRGNFTFSDTISTHHNPDGTLTLIGATGKPIVENLSINPDGSMTDHAINELQAKGMHVGNLSHMLDIQHTETRQITLHEFMQRHSEQTTHVTRDVWYDNDTPAPIFDKNELGLHWGAGGSGVAHNGHIQMSVATMASGGSYHDALHTAWQHNAQQGTLKLAISPSANTQTTPFMLDIRADGTVNIPPDSPAAKFFAIKDGQAVFNGKYAEVVQTLQTDNHGVEHVRPLATLVGRDNVGTLRDQVVTTTHELQPGYRITAPPIEVNIPTFTEMAPVIPLVSRRSLENLRLRNTVSPYYADYYRETPIDQAEYREYSRDFSPRLRNNPNATLNPGEELAWYRDHLQAIEGSDYIQETEEMIAQSPELSNITDTTEAIVTVPVAAIAESDNIYKTLSGYARQDEYAKQKTLVLLHVNWLSDAEDDPSSKAAIQKTLAEIERARKDFPDLRIAVTKKIYDRHTVEKTGGVIGYIARDMLASSLLGLQKQVEAGKRSADKDTLIIRNDADQPGISRHHWRSMIESAKKYGESDIFKGVTRFGVRTHFDTPGWSMVANMQTILTSRAALRGHTHTGGANFGVRASILAAIGGVGKQAKTGIGSDDVNIGRRIAVARRGSTSSGYHEDTYVPSSSPTQSLRKVTSLVGGATIDTDAVRFVDDYNKGYWWQEVWDRGKKGGFADGAGGYRPRDVSAKESSKDSKPSTSDAYKSFEYNMSRELGYADPVERTRVLSLLFKDCPGAYKLESQKDSEIKFTLTHTGRRFMKNREGKRRSYGQKQLEALYGLTASGQSLGRIRPLVSNI